MKTSICPKCGHTYQGYPALSRVDNRTEICPDCGIREAMEDAGIVFPILTGKVFLSGYYYAFW